MSRLHASKEVKGRKNNEVMVQLEIWVVLMYRCYCPLTAASVTPFSLCLHLSLSLPWFPVSLHCRWRSPERQQVIGRMIGSLWGSPLCPLICEEIIKMFKSKVYQRKKKEMEKLSIFSLSAVQNISKPFKESGGSSVHKGHGGNKANQDTLDDSDGIRSCHSPAADNHLEEGGL